MTTGDASRAIQRRLFRRARAYAETFLNTGRTGVAAGGPSIVLEHLHTFCHATRPTVKVGPDGRIDPIAMAIAEGRREVWLEIQKMLTLDSRDVEAAIERAVHETQEEQW